MTRSQWLLVAAIGIIAVVAFVRSDMLARRLDAAPYRKPTTQTA